MDELDQALIDWQKALELFEDKLPLLTSELWDMMAELLENTRLKLIDRLENDENMKPCCVRAQMRLIKQLKDTPRQVQEVMEELREKVNDLEKAKVIQELTEKSFNGGM